MFYIVATHFLQIIRGIILKGTGIYELWKPVTVLLGMSIILMVISVKKFKVRL